MLDKLIALVKAQRSLRRVSIFFLAFAASLTVMGSSHDIFYGNGSQQAPEKARTAQDGAAAQEDGINCTFASYEQQKQQPAADMMLAVKAVNLEEIVTTAVEDKKDGAKAVSKKESGEEAETKTKSSKTAKQDAEPEEPEEETDGSEESSFVYSDQIPMSPELQQYTYTKCEERGLEYELVLAIIWRESRFNVDAVNVNTNGTRDNGIMQINDVNRQWLLDNFGITDLMDPYQNIDAGTAMLGRLTGKYGSHNAMLAYQYGEGGMAKKLKQGITTSTAIEQAYTQRDYYRKII